MAVNISKIKIKVSKYYFDKENYPPFMGRKEEKDRLKRRITPSKSDENISRFILKFIKPKTKSKSKPDKYFGAYLIAGNRGMGKSTLVKEVIDELKQNGDEIIDIKVYLSQGTFSDFDLLKQIFIQLENKLKERRSDEKPDLILPFIFLLLFPVFFLLLLWFIECLCGLLNLEANYIDFSQLHYAVVLISLSIFAAILCIRLLKYHVIIDFKKDEKKLFNKLEHISKRLLSNLEIGENLVAVPQNSNYSFLNSIPILNKNENKAYKQVYSKITSKELEFEIKELLNCYHELRVSKETAPILFVIDELDKLEPEFIEGTNDYLELGKSRYDTRKEALTTLLANLKSFIHTAQAKFIFIGGSDMYDASLADVADRESFYSSIFHEVIYVKSFFKEKANSGYTLTEMIEKYLYHVMLGLSIEDEESENTTSYFQRIANTINKDSSNEVSSDEVSSNFKQTEKDFVIYQLFRYLVYLTYRSNGSPKKLKELIEYELQMPNNTREINEPIIEIKIPKKQEKASVKIEKEWWGCIETSIEPQNKNDVEENFSMFQFDSFRQYEIGLLSNIFLPSILNNQSYLKLFNDKNLYLSAFLMDNILKFHKSAFSWRQLELLPDIILGSNAPDLRDTLKELIDYLLIKHIRETTNAMFQFKFRSNTAMELDFLTKISDESAAAFNFSFDESYHLKAFFKRKLKQKIQTYKENGFHNSDSSFIQTLSNLNSTIANLHYYDEEYESSIRYYSDSIQEIQNMISNDTHLTNDQKIIFVKNNLFLSLCYERSYNFDLAYSSLREIILRTTNWHYGVEKAKKEIDHSFSYFYKEEWEEPYKRLQLFLRPHIALLMIIEKDRSDGITGDNLRRNIKEYTSLLGVIELFPQEKFRSDIDFQDFIIKEGDHVRIQTLLADYYQNVGSILFFKNAHLKKIFDAGIDGIMNELLGVNITKDGVLNKIIRKKVNERRLFVPSFTAFLYYTTSLVHLTAPYEENIKELGLYQKSHGLLSTLEILSNENRYVILNGKHKEFLGLIVSKFSDSILSCIDSVSEFPKLNKDNIETSFLTTKFLSSTKKKYDEFMSMNGVFYFNILSYKYFYSAGRKYDALSRLIKCLHILRVHFFSRNDNGVYKHKDSFKNLIIFKDWLITKSYEIINVSDFSST